MSEAPREKPGLATGDERDAFADLIERTRAPAKPVEFGGGAIERRSLSEQVANRIMAMIKSGNLKPGDRLPTEQQMGIAFGISRPPLREALKALIIMGLLESRQGGRYIVTDLSPSRLVAPFNLTLAAADYDVDGHFEARVAVELELARLCIERATDDDRQRIAKLAVDGRAFHEHPAAFRLLDIEFHEAVNSAAYSPVLGLIGRALYDVGLDIRRLASAQPSVIVTSVAQHIEFAEAVVARDVDAGRDSFRRHLEHVRDYASRSMHLNGGSDRK